MIVTPRDELGRAPDGADPARPSTWWPAEMARRTGTPLALPAGELGVSVEASVNWGRWVADCPMCRTAQTVDPDDPRMWCPICRPPGWATVAFPARWRDIASLLADRLPANRNWSPWETLDQLEAENRAGGPVAVDEDGPHVIAAGTVLHPASELA